ncbi:MAG TPA: hypothetical protein PKH33_18485, partial [bacterium]|nr:hypothetical protein [bacterium]
MPDYFSDLLSRFIANIELWKEDYKSFIDNPNMQLLEALFNSSCGSDYNQVKEKMTHYSNEFRKGSGVTSSNFRYKNEFSKCNIQFSNRQSNNIYSHDFCEYGILTKGANCDCLKTVCDKFTTSGSLGGSGFKYSLFKIIAAAYQLSSKGDKHERVTNGEHAEIANIENHRKECLLMINKISEHIRSEGYTFSSETIKNYYISLKTKPFVILTGISGTGKTKLAQLFAQAIYGKAED